jgi:glycosyltransferase involved in cell wall biosynthesis
LAKRIRIALSYTYNELWIGGSYYIENLISALDTLPDTEKPHLAILVSGEADARVAKNKLTYPYISFQLSSGESNRLFRFMNKVTTRLFRKTIFNQKIKGLDAAFPYYDCVQQSLAAKKIYWIADFQESFAPEFFTPEAIDTIQKHQHTIQSSAETLILSSNDALTHFKALYPAHTVKSHILPFAVTHPPYRQLDIPSLLNKHQLPTRFFICPNQFWKHKNQLTVLKAVNKLKQQGTEIMVAFTGKTSDYRHPDYFASLEKYVVENDLGNNIKFLGFIDRREQLKLMTESIAIIQPSFFEGWSTVVEDAKAMNKALMASAINVHTEQLAGSSAQFFSPNDTDELAALLNKAANGAALAPLYKSDAYQSHIEKFGRDFLTICKS